MNKLIKFLQDKNPFDRESSLRNVVTGVIAAEKVNVTQAKEVGDSILDGMFGKKVCNYTFQKKDTAITMESKSKIQIDAEDVHIDPQLLFQRLVIIGTQKDKLNEAFRHELCGFPAALFERRDVLLKATKPVLANAIWELAPAISDEDQEQLESSHIKHVIDRGALLHRILWENGQTYDATCQRYATYVMRKYKQPTVIFDGYDCGPAPKDGTQSRRIRSGAVRDVHVSPGMQLNMKKDDILASKTNKQKFINMLSSSLEKSGCEVHQADGDADIVIVAHALKSAETCDTIVVGDDTDLMILLCHHATSNHKKLYFHPEAKSGQQRRYMDIHKARSELGDQVCRDLLFVHAMLGCDTTSRLFGFGKAVGLKLIQTNETFIEQAKVFNRSGCTQSEVAAAGEKAILCLYKTTAKIDDLNELRHQRFLELVKTSKKEIQPKSLPPTSAAAKFHSQRVYHQVQAWKNVGLDAEEWGWKIVDGQMIPVQTCEDVAPRELLEFVRCQCKTGCSTNHCSCKKTGISCTTACGECRGVCENGGDDGTEMTDGTDENNDPQY